MSALMQTYARLPVTFSHGEGVYLFDTEGRRYLDGISGIGVNALGHAHPAVTAAITQQADKLVHSSNLYRISTQEELADSLTKAGRDGQRLFWQFRGRGERGRHQAGPTAWPPPGHQAARHRRAGGRIPRPHTRHPERYWQPQDSGWL